nr:hypothetical protein Ade03nite_61710 [Actinoplanes derwentensis]
MGEGRVVDREPGPYVRDATFREGLHQARTGTGPAAMAVLRNTAIGWHRINGATDIARANRRSHDLITAVTRSYTRTFESPMSIFNIRWPNAESSRAIRNHFGFLTEYRRRCHRNGSRSRLLLTASVSGLR